MIVMHRVRAIARHEGMGGMLFRFMHRHPALRALKLRLAKRAAWLQNKVKLHRGWFLALLMSVAVWAIMEVSVRNVEADNARYVLSTISQSLAAIFGLIFTIILVMTQITKKITALDIFFSSETILYMFVYSTGILTPFMVLATGSLTRLNEIIALTAFCIFAVIPFLKSVGRKLKYTAGTESLLEEALDAVKEIRHFKIETIISEFHAIGVSAATELREQELKNIIFNLCKLYSHCSLSSYYRLSEQILETIVALSQTFMERLSVPFRLGHYSVLALTKEIKKVIGSRNRDLHRELYWTLISLGFYFYQKQRGLQARDLLNIGNSGKSYSPEAWYLKGFMDKTYELRKLERESLFSDLLFSRDLRREMENKGWQKADVDAFLSLIQSVHAEHDKKRPRPGPSQSPVTHPHLPPPHASGRILR